MFHIPGGIPEPTDASVLSGYLVKQGGARGGAKTWKRRWFAVRGDALYYYKDDQCSHLLGRIPLRGAVFMDYKASNSDYYDDASNAIDYADVQGTHVHTNHLASPQVARQPNTLPISRCHSNSRRRDLDRDRDRLTSLQLSRMGSANTQPPLTSCSHAPHALSPAPVTSDALTVTGTSLSATASAAVSGANSLLGATAEDPKHCYECKAPFSSFASLPLLSSLAPKGGKRQRCRVCQHSFCPRCIAATMPMPHLGFAEPVPVCAVCHEDELLQASVARVQARGGPVSARGAAAGRRDVSAVVDVLAQDRTAVVLGYDDSYQRIRCDGDAPDSGAVQAPSQPTRGRVFHFGLANTAALAHGQSPRQLKAHVHAHAASPAGAGPVRGRVPTARAAAAGLRSPARAIAAPSDRDESASVVYTLNPLFSRESGGAPGSTLTTPMAAAEAHGRLRANTLRRLPTLPLKRHATFNRATIPNIPSVPVSLPPSPSRAAQTPTAPLTATHARVTNTSAPPSAGSVAGTDSSTPLPSPAHAGALPLHVDTRTPLALLRSLRLPQLLRNTTLPHALFSIPRTSRHNLFALRTDGRELWLAAPDVATKYSWLRTLRALAADASYLQQHWGQLVLSRRSEGAEVVSVTGAEDELSQRMTARLATLAHRDAAAASALMRHRTGVAARGMGGPFDLARLGVVVVPFGRVARGDEGVQGVIDVSYFPASPPRDEPLPSRNAASSRLSSHAEVDEEAVSAPQVHAAPLLTLPPAPLSACASLVSVDTDADAFMAPATTRSRASAHTVSLANNTPSQRAGVPACELVVAPADATLAPSPTPSPLLGTTLLPPAPTPLSPSAAAQGITQPPSSLTTKFSSLLAPGSLLVGPRVGGGAYGDVYKGLLWGTPVAVKTLKQQNPSNPDAVATPAPALAWVDSRGALAAVALATWLVEALHANSVDWTLLPYEGADAPSHSRASSHGVTRAPTHANSLVRASMTASTSSSNPHALPALSLAVRGDRTVISAPGGTVLSELAIGACMGTLLDDLCKEVGILAQLRHPNVVLFMGVTVDVPVATVRAQAHNFYVTRLAKTDLPALARATAVDTHRHAAMLAAFLSHTACSAPSSPVLKGHVPGTAAAADASASASGATHDSVFVYVRDDLLDPREGADTPRAPDATDDAATALSVDEQKLVFAPRKLRHAPEPLRTGLGVCVVTEWCELGSLFDILYDFSIPLATKQLLEFAMGIAQGMNYLHNLQPKLVHRDLKSQNILIDRYFNVKVCDFGLSFARDALLEAMPLQCPHCLNTSTACTCPRIEGLNTGGHSGAAYGILGTVEWMCPEMVIGGAYTEKIDVYSYGILLTEVFARQMPYSDLLPSTDYHVVAEAVILHGMQPTIPLWSRQLIAPLITRCLSRNPRDRPSFHEVTAHLHALLSREDAYFLFQCDLPRIYECLCDHRQEVQGLGARELTQLCSSGKVYVEVELDGEGDGDEEGAENGLADADEDVDEVVLAWVKDDNAKKTRGAGGGTVSDGCCCRLHMQGHASQLVSASLSSTLTLSLNESGTGYTGCDAVRFVNQYSKRQYDLWRERAEREGQELERDERERARDEFVVAGEEWAVHAAAQEAEEDARKRDEEDAAVTRVTAYQALSGDQRKRQQRQRTLEKHLAHTHMRANAMRLRLPDDDVVNLLCRLCALLGAMRAPDSFSEDDLHYTAWLLSLVEALHALLAATGAGAHERRRDESLGVCVGVCDTCSQHEAPTRSSAPVARPRSTREWCCELVSEEGVLWPLILMSELRMQGEENMRDDCREAQREARVMRAEVKRRAAGGDVSTGPLPSLSTPELLERIKSLSERAELFAHALSLYSSLRSNASRLLLFILTALDALALRRLLDAANGEVLVRLAALVRVDAGEAVAVARGCGEEARRRAELFSELGAMARERGAAEEVGAALVVEVRVHAGVGGKDAVESARREAHVDVSRTIGGSDIRPAAAVRVEVPEHVGMIAADVADDTPVDGALASMQSLCTDIASAHADTCAASVDGVASVPTSPSSPPAASLSPPPSPLSISSRRVSTPTSSQAPLQPAPLTLSPDSTPGLASLAEPTGRPSLVSRTAQDSDVLDSLRRKRTVELSELPRGKVAMVASRFSEQPFSINTTPTGQQ